MKFKLLSDLHLEFHPEHNLWEPEYTKYDEDTTLLLAGDIHVGGKAQYWIRGMCERFANVIYILGNHEFYNNEVNNVKKNWKELDMPENFYFLDDDVVYFGDTRVIGGTLWTGITDLNAVWPAHQRMTDYRIICLMEHGKLRNINVQDTNRFHAQTINFIMDELEKPWEGKTIVMTHHMPHPECIHPKYKGDMLNPFFVTDLDHIIKKYDINYWCHGHTHEEVDVKVHGTHILCNPKGYFGYEVNEDFNEGLILVVP